jgi:hypothetical protein
MENKKQSVLNNYENLRMIRFDDKEGGTVRTKQMVAGTYTDPNTGIKYQNVLNYVSWATAMDVLLQNYPDATWREIEFHKDGTQVIEGSEVEVTEMLPNGGCRIYKAKDSGVPYREVAGTYEVMTEVTIDGVTKSCRLPIMIQNHAAMKIDSALVNKALKRCFVKNLAYFGIGLYLYAGEDFVDDEDTNRQSLRTNVNNEKKPNLELPKSEDKKEKKTTAKKETKAEQKVELDTDGDPMTRTIRTPFENMKKVVGQPMSKLIVDAKSKDTSLKMLDWYKKNGKDGDSELAQTLLAMLEAGKISFPKELEEQTQLDI